MGRAWCCHWGFIQGGHTSTASTVTDPAMTYTCWIAQGAKTPGKMCGAKLSLLSHLCLFCVCVFVCVCVCVCVLVRVCVCVCVCVGGGTF